jgi:hypothetical protein|tara:strand:- start:15531 stop:16541 length:1011 start_codon:yes stop_codon:yes gene_type:complete
MASLATTFETYQTVGDREDLSDLIADISPTQTPFQSNIGTRSAENTYFEWQTDELSAAAAAGVVEGNNLATFNAVSPTTRLGNYCQINMRDFLISGTQQRVEKAGRASEVGYQAAKAAKELKRNVEKAALWNQGAVVGATATARGTAGFPAWVKSNVVVNAATAPTWSAGTPIQSTATDIWALGAPTAFTEAMLQSAMQQCYESGGEPTMLMVSPYNKTVVSGFTGLAGSRYNVDAGASPTTIIGAADIYVSDFGNLSVVPNRFFTTVVEAGGSAMNDWGMLVDPDEVKLSTLRPYSIEALAKSGDADKRMALIEWGLQVNNEKAHGMVAGITAVA